MSNSARHKRDFRQSRTYVVVRGIGTKNPGTGTQLVYAVYTTHAGDYPCRYLPNGWGGDPYFNADIETLALAQAVADAVGSRAWGALGQLTWRTDGVAVGGTAITEFAEGDLISYHNPVEGQIHHVYPILEVNPVTGTVGHPVWEILAGERQPDFLDIIQQLTAVTRVQEAVGNAGGGQGQDNLTLGIGMPGAPRQVALSKTPIHYARNAIQPNNNWAASLLTRTGFIDPALPPPSYDNFEVQIGSQAYSTVHGRWIDGFWTSGQDGRPHPYIVDFGYIDANGTYGTHIPYHVAMTRLDLKGTGTVQLRKNTTDIGPPCTVTGTAQVFPVGGTPWEIGDDLFVVVTGVGAAPGISIKVWDSND